jgi:hypothetical protein
VPIAWASSRSSTPRRARTLSGARYRDSYNELEHCELPGAIRETEESCTLCPKTAVAMMKRLR